MWYVIMCGGNYEFQKPLVKINGETLVERTIRLLRENNIKNIYISSNNPEYEKFGVPILKHENNYIHETNEGSWLNAYYPTNEPCCYLHGDVFFSNDAIKQIIESSVKDALFICTFDGSDRQYKRNPMNTCGREPFGYKVVNQKKFRKAIDDLKAMQNDFIIKPFSWHVYRYLNGLPLKQKATKFTQINNIFNTQGEKLLINDYTRDIDTKEQIKILENNLKKWGIS